jgi:hypothetical protein
MMNGYFLIEKDLIEDRFFDVLFCLFIKIKMIDYRMEESKLIELIFGKTIFRMLFR